MTLRRSLARMLLVGSLLAAGLVAAAPPVQAAFHLIKIREVGLDVQGGEDFIELQMYSSGQTLVGGHELILYGETGDSQNFLIPGDVSNGTNQATILFATPGFTGASPDFGMLPGGLTSDGGAICFETIDCVEWGPSGRAEVMADPPAPAPGPGQSLERRISAGCATLLEAGDDTGSSAADFAAVSPNPEPNSTTPNESPCEPGTPGGTPVLQGLKARVKGGRATVSGTIQPPAPGEQVKLTFFANGSPLRKLASKSATLNATSTFKKRFKVPSESTRCKVVVRFRGAKLGQKKFKC